MILSLLPAKKVALVKEKSLRVEGDLGMDGRKRMPQKRLSWRKAALWGILMTPLSMIVIYLLLGFLPEALERLIRSELLQHPFLAGLVFYLCGVAAFRWIGLDLSKREDWPDIPG